MLAFHEIGVLGGSFCNPARCRLRAAGDGLAGRKVHCPLCRGSSKSAMALHCKDRRAWNETDGCPIRGQALGDEVTKLVLYCPRVARGVDFCASPVCCCWHTRSTSASRGSDIVLSDSGMPRLGSQCFGAYVYVRSHDASSSECPPQLAKINKQSTSCIINIADGTLLNVEIAPVRREPLGLPSILHLRVRPARLA